MKTIKGTFLIIMLMMILGGCRSIHDAPPENGGVDPTLVNVKLKLSIKELEMEPFSLNRVTGASINESHDLRYVVEIYRQGQTQVPENVIQRSVVVPQSSDSISLNFDLKLHARKYTLLLWADYVPKGSADDHQYDVGSLLSIKIQDSYVGSSDDKDAFSGVLDLDLTQYRDQWNVTVDKVAELERHMAKYEIVTTDIVKYVDRIGKGASVDMEGMKVKVMYDGYFPSGYNVLTGKPNDALQGLGFESIFEVFSKTDGRLAFDYVFVNGVESAVSASLIISDKNGVQVNRVDGISIPLRRAVVTTIQGEFLTKDYSPGIGINPDFEGNIDVVIPD